MSGAAERPAEVLREESGIRVDGQQAMGSRSAYILRMPGICPGKRPPGPDLSSTCAVISGSGQRPGRFFLTIREDGIRLRKLKNSGRLRNSPPTCQNVVQQKFALRVKTRFHSFRDSAGCTIAMRCQRKTPGQCEVKTLSHVRPNNFRQAERSPFSLRTKRFDDPQVHNLWWQAETADQIRVALVGA
jgi:hypothetical protein